MSSLLPGFEGGRQRVTLVEPHSSHPFSRAFPLKSHGAKTLGLLRRGLVNLQAEVPQSVYWTMFIENRRVASDL
jgi:hypothetical protein